MLDDIFKELTRGYLKGTVLTLKLIAFGIIISFFMTLCS